ncbi:hypothetical protein K474DRAFT_1712092 [Panus rudis PR-1116 ss-1]|nr:hypothetical protein K474DRAFT_1712092 [Panus rudis PR-1116 ss-1]
MPFSRYLQDAARNDDEHFLDGSGVDASTFSSNVQFQMPQLMLGPTVAPGGGAEVLPAGMLANPIALSAPWFASSSFNRHPAFHNPAQYFAQKSEGQEEYIPNGPPPGHLAYPSNPNFPVSLPPSISVYSVSGFDLLSILARVASRPFPKIVLGPVDLSCAFVVTDKRRFDNPIVYASPTFCRLTGYSEQEVLGTNCRFLQSPGGKVAKGSHRQFTSNDAVSYLRSAVLADKECQTSMINYRKDGSAFVNLVTVIPVPGGANNDPEEVDDIVYTVGFQVDLTEQPSAILNRLRDGTYIVNYSNPGNQTSPANGARDWRTSSAVMSGVGKELRLLLTDPAFTTSLPVALTSTALSSPADRSDPYDGNKLLNLILLQSTADFVHVVSLKGAFLYVAPNIKKILGYGPEELVGKSISEYCHPADVVPLMRELKESSTGHLEPPVSAAASATSAQGLPKVVDLLFRMRAKDSTYVWLESRGRLHVEPGKGRKAIILSGRVRQMPALHWGSINRSGILDHHAKPVDGPEGIEEGREVWGLVSGDGSHGTVLFVGSAVRHVLGWGAGELIGRPILDLIGTVNPAAIALTSLQQNQSTHDDGTDLEEERRRVKETLVQAVQDRRRDTREVICWMCKKDGSTVQVRLLFFHPSKRTPASPSSSASTSPSFSSYPLPTSATRSQAVVCHIRLLESVRSPYPHESPTSNPTFSHDDNEDVFEEIDASKSSSWQYELQQLKYTNQRLMEELLELEDELFGPPDDSSSESDKTGRNTKGANVGANMAVLTPSSSGSMHASPEKQHRQQQWVEMHPIPASSSVSSISPSTSSRPTTASGTYPPPHHHQQQQQHQPPQHLRRVTTHLAGSHVQQYPGQTYPSQGSPHQHHQQQQQQQHAQGGYARDLDPLDRRRTQSMLPMKRPWDAGGDGD